MARAAGAGWPPRVNINAPPDARTALLASLPVAVMGFTGAGALFLVNAEMLRLLRMDPAALPLGAGERDVFRMLAYRGIFGAGDPEQRLREWLAPGAAQTRRHMLRDVDGRSLELRMSPLPTGGHALTLADVTELVQARETADREARALSSLLGSMGNGVAQYDDGHRLVRSNPAYARLIGLEPQALHPGMTVRDVIERQVAAGELERAVADRVLGQLATRPAIHAWRHERTRPNGATIRFENQPAGGGGWIAELTDITEHVSAAQLASRRLALQDALLDALPVGIAVYGPDRVLASMNPAYNQIMAHSPVRLGEHLGDILLRRAEAGEFGPCDPQAEAARRLAMVSTAHGFERRWPGGVATSHRSIPLPDGGHAMVISDVTALQDAMADARVRTELLGTMLESTRHGIAMFDAGGTVIAANRLAARLCGIPEGRFVPGATIDELRAIQLSRAVGRNDEAASRFLAERMNNPLRAPDLYRRAGRDGRVIEIITDRLPDGGFVRSFTDVSAQVRAEAEATLRAETLQTVLDNMRHGVILYDESGRVRTANALAAQLSGVPPELLQPGIHFDTLRDIQAEAGEHGSGAAADAYRLGRVREPWKGQGTYTRQRPDGTIIEVRTDLTPGGGCIRSFTDITALAHAQAEAANRAALVQLMLDNMRHGIALFDAEQRLLTANTLCAELMGLGSALPPGASLQDVVNLQAEAGEFGDEPATAQRVAMLRLRDVSVPFTYRRTRPNGAEVEVATNPVPGGGFVLTLTDITARVVAEREVERRATVLGATLNAARQGIILFDAQGIAIAANEIAAQMTSSPDGPSLVGRDHLAIMLDQRRTEGAGAAEMEAVRRDFAKVDRRQPQRYQRERSDGRVVDISSDPMPGGGYVVCVSDVTELVRAREQAQAKAAALAATLDASRHTIALYGPDHRLITGNRISSLIAGFGSVEQMAGLTLEEVLRRQLANEGFETAEEGEAFVQHLLALDRSKPIRYQRRRPTGDAFDVASDPTPDGGFVISVSDVTSLLDAQEEAQRRAGILQVMLDNSRHGVVLYDRNHRLVAANSLAGELMGVPDLLARPGTPQSEILAAQRARGLYGGDDDGAELERYFLEVDRSQPYRMQRTLPDGRRFDISSDPTPDGGFVISLADVTPLVRAEAAAESRAGLLRTMLENNTSGVLLYDRDQRLVAFNSLAAELVNIPDLGAHVGQHMGEIMKVQASTGGLGLDGEAVRQRLLALDRSKPMRGQRVTAYGRILTTASDPTPDGGFVISLNDVTPLARAEAEAKRRAEILGIMLNNIRHGIVLFDGEGRLVASNPKLREMLDLPDDLLPPGITQSEMVDTLWQRGEYGEGEQGRAVAETIKARARNQGVRSLRQRHDGTVLEVVSDPTPDGGWVITYTDVTDDRRIRAELEAARGAAEAANRAKSRFLATMSHELRTPLNAVIGFSQVLRGGASPEQTQEFAGAILEAGKHLLSLIDEILDVTRTETGSLPVTLAPVELAPLLEGTLRMVSPAAASGKLQLSIEMPQHLPRLSADERRLRQVLLNLLSNATKFTPQGGSVTLSAAMEAGALVIAVRDTGIGIGAEDMRRVFEPFTQIDSAMSRRFPGSGLGLHLGRVLTEAQGGTLTLESTPGEGTTAFIRFPASSLMS